MWRIGFAHTATPSKPAPVRQIRPVDQSDDHLSHQLHRLSQDTKWNGFHQESVKTRVRTCRSEPEVARHDSTSASGHSPVSEEGVIQMGFSKDRRPDSGQFKIMFSALDPSGLPLVVEIVPGCRADDPLYVPAVESVRAVSGGGPLHAGDCEIAAIDTRARIVDGKDDYLCPLPKI